MIKDKKILGFIALGIILLIGGFLLLSNKNSSSSTPAIQVEEETKVLSITPEEIGLTLVAGADNKRVIMTVSKTEDIDSLDYELSYVSKGNIPRGAISHIDVKTKGKPVTQEIVLGTCSDVCHYDEGVSSVKLVLKVTKTDGKVYQAEKSLSL